jgi:hypothetical protein
MNPDWPLSYRWLRANGLAKLVPWHFYDSSKGRRIDNVFATECIDATKVRTFAFRQDCDDFAAFVMNEQGITEEVVYFHPSFGGLKNPYLINGRFPDLITFLSVVALADTLDWMSELDLEDLQKAQ